MVQWVKNLPAIQETHDARVRCLGWDDISVKEMAIHSSILAWKIPWTVTSSLQSDGSQKVAHNWVTKHKSTQLKIPSQVRLQAVCVWEPVLIEVKTLEDGLADKHSWTQLSRGPTEIRKKGVLFFLMITFQRNGSQVLERVPMYDLLCKVASVLSDSLQPYGM